MENKGLITQIKIPADINKELRIEAIKAGMTLREYCVKVLTDHVQKGSD